jgi:hypothetical protein
MAKLKNKSLLYLKMKNIIALFLFSLCMVKASAQIDTTVNKILTKAETDEFFTTDFKKKNLINFPIFRAYTYTDKSGTYYIALTESADILKKEKDTINYTIKAFNFKTDKKGTLKKWEVNDFRLPNVKSEEREESIWFWTKYCSFSDLDKDGFVDPVIVYGTFGKQGYADGRAKILIYYKGQKVAIRHQNSISEQFRKTQIDTTFYALPQQIQLHIKEIMAKMVEKKHAVFTENYLGKMELKEVSIN